jgi:threonine-phosphate decarboxylase
MSKHGGNIVEAAQQCGCTPEEIIDFSSNINSCSPRVEMRINSDMIRPYADPEYRELKTAVAKRYGLKPSQTALFNGASSAIFSLFETLRPQSCVLYAPLYGEYKAAASRYAAKVRLINRFTELEAVPPKGSSVVFVNPSTPDGKWYDLERLLELWKERDCNVIVDESFLEFTNRPSVRKFLKRYKKLYIVQSLTKFYACAGVRVGALFSHPKNIAALNRPAWPISSFDAAYMGEALKDKKHAKRSRKEQAKRHAELAKLLKNSPLFSKVYPSEANYIMVKSRKRAAAVAAKLLEHRILVRDCSNFGFLGTDHLRFAVKDRSSHQWLRKALRALA